MKKFLGSWTTTLLISNEQIKGIMKIFQSLDDPNLIIKDATKTSGNETKEHRDLCLSMLLGTFRLKFIR